jgi:hypothetical protein
MNKKLTVVTGIWDLKRDQAGDGFKRAFSHYIDHFKKLLKTDYNLFIYIEKEYEHIIWESGRSRENTFVVVKPSSEFKDHFPFYNQVKQIRHNESWLSQASWLAQSTQATLDLYNPMVMSKMFMLNDAKIHNPFDTDYFIWLDGAITNTVHEGYFSHDKVLDKIDSIINKFLFISFPYVDGPEIHGFARDKMAEYCGTDPQYVCRAGIFGGHKDYISDANALYYSILNDSISKGLMGTEESIFTIMAHLIPEDYSRYELKDEDCGLLSNFFEMLKNLNPLSKKPQLSKTINSKTALYVLTFNSPDQFSKLIDSFKQVPNFFDDIEKYVLDNSTDESVFSENQKLADENNFILIKKNNIGICGGRQFIAEHFSQTDCEYMLFFEDDMFLNPPSEAGYCKNGLRKYVKNILQKSIKIMDREKFDFIKLSFSEFFGDNKTQWAWYNVPQNIREKYWPNYHKLPENGLDPNAPLTEYKHMKNQDDLTYLTGDVYYANWPQIVSKSGNKKMFLDTTWSHPYEQTWMSHIFQETKVGKITSGILLASPITHDRFIHYDQSMRVES